MARLGKSELMAQMKSSAEAMRKVAKRKERERTTSTLQEQETRTPSVPDLTRRS